MKRSTRTPIVPGLGLLAVALGAAVPARAEQLVLDETYTATTSNTTDSHYYVKPPAGWPANWSSPVNYGKGAGYVRFDVLEKPSAKKTYYNICFEGNSGTCCMPLSPLYSPTGLVTFDAQFSSFWNYNTVDWSKGLHQIALILKDENQNKVQGSADFYPTKIHVTITIVPQGGTYVPPVMTDAGMMMPPASDAGVGKDAGMRRDAGMIAAHDAGSAGRGAAGSSMTPRDAGMPRPVVDAATPSRGTAGNSVQATASGGSSAAAAPAVATGGTTAAAGAASVTLPATSQSGSGCSVYAVRPGSSSFAASGLLALLFRMRRRKRALAGTLR